MCVLTGKKILELGILQDVESQEAVQPASIDLRLGMEFKHIGEEPFKSFSYTLQPGEFILAHTIERADVPTTYVARVEGKSTPARAGLIIHSAGFIDPGFRGQITLEISNRSHEPYHLSYGQYIGQLSVMKMEEEATAYSGRYQDSVGVIGAR